MTFNVHPIFVHFPVALLTLYSVFELARFKKLQEQPWLFYVKGVLVTTGAAACYVALLTGEIAAGYQGSLRYIIRHHEFWAKLTTTVFSALAAGYIVEWLNRYNFASILANDSLQKLWSLLGSGSRVLLKPQVVTVLALVGLAAVTITGALGGSIAYGPGSDPFTNFVFKLIVGKY